MTDPNDLFAWLSAKGSGTWSRYRAAVDDMQVTDESSGVDEDIAEDMADRGGFPVYHRLRLNLERLGHAEFFRNDFPNGWRIVPPTLASVDTKIGAVGVLCGARTDQLMARIKSAAGDLRIEKCPQPECPDRILVIAEEQSELRQLAAAAGVYFQSHTPCMLLAAVPPVDEWQFRMADEMPFGEDREVSQFSPETLGWTAAEPHEARRALFGLYRFQVRFQPQYYLRLSGRTFRLPVQVGKYIVLKKAGRRVLSYNDANQTLSMPVSCRPPLLVDRALTLCSGLISPINDGRFEYPNVNKDIAHTARTLLKQEMS
jgi:hypothetical protein